MAITINPKTIEKTKFCNAFILLFLTINLIFSIFFVYREHVEKILIERCHKAIAPKLERHNILGRCSYWIYLSETGRKSYLCENWETKPKRKTDYELTRRKSYLCENWFISLKTQYILVDYIHLKGRTIYQTKNVKCEKKCSAKIKIIPNSDILVFEASLCKKQEQ